MSCAFWELKIQISEIPMFKKCIIRNSRAVGTCPPACSRCGEISSARCDETSVVGCVETSVARCGETTATVGGCSNRDNRMIGRNDDLIRASTLSKTYGISHCWPPGKNRRKVFDDTLPYVSPKRFALSRAVASASGSIPILFGTTTDDAFSCAWLSVIGASCCTFCCGWPRFPSSSFARP